MITNKITVVRMLVREFDGYKEEEKKNFVWSFIANCY